MNGKTEQTTRQYFATLPAKELAAEVLERVSNYDKYISASGRGTIWRNSYNHYNMGIFKDAGLNRTGEQLEYTDMYVNHFRNILTHMLNMTTQQRPSFDVRATNTDSKSQSQTIVGNNVLDYYNRFKGMDAVAKQAVEDALVFDTAYVYQGWDFSLGDPYMADPNSPGGTKRQGDILHKNYTPFDVIFSVAGGLNGSKAQWHIIRDFQNKWDLAARYPEIADKIINTSADMTRSRIRVPAQLVDPEDEIPVYIFMHDRTDAMPQGRMFTMISQDIWLIDTMLPEFYKTLPLHRLQPAPQRGTGFGYTVAYDLLPLQEALDGLHSVIITNQSTFGVQNIWIKTGSNLSTTEIADGLNLLQSDEKPEVLQLLSTAPEIFQFLQSLEAQMETISGVNSVARGNPEQSLKSGAALALVQSMAIQFINGMQQAYTIFLENMGMGVISILQKCATTGRMVEIAGKANEAYTKQFTGADLQGISRVTVDMGNPLARTTAGKVNMAENLLNAKLINNPEEYLQVLTTGKLEPILEGQQAQLMLIRSENEALADGKPVRAVATDNHPLHVLEHQTVLSNPDVRTDPNNPVTAAALAHIQEHIQLWKETDPALAIMLKVQPPPPPPMPMMPPGEVHPGQNGAHMNGANGKTLLNVNPTAAKAATVQQPRMPINPMTHKPADQAAPGG